MVMFKGGGRKELSNDSEDNPIVAGSQDQASQLTKDTQDSQLSNFSDTPIEDRADYALDRSLFSMYTTLPRRLVRKFIDAVKVFTLLSFIPWGSIFSGTDIDKLALDSFTYVVRKVFYIKIKFKQPFMCEKDAAKQNFLCHTNKDS